MEDVPAIMKFIGENWKKDHILARDEAFFCWMYVDEKGCNVVLAVDEENTIYGMLAVIKYNSTDQPDIVGTMWKVLHTGNPRLGVELAENCLLYTSDAADE